MTRRITVLAASLVLAVVLLANLVGAQGQPGTFEQQGAALGQSADATIAALQTQVAELQPTATPTLEPTATEVPSTATTVPPTPAPVESSYQVLYSTHPDRSNPQPLAGATVAGVIYVFTLPETNVSYVDFTLDGTFMRSESGAPYDLMGGTVAAAAPFETAGLANGAHALHVEIKEKGVTQKRVLNAAFTVANGETGQTPEPTEASATPTTEPTTAPEPTATVPPADPTPEPAPTEPATGSGMTLVPTFHSIGIYIPGVGGTADVAMEWRVAGSNDWTDGHPLMVDPQTGEARGSLVGMTPATSYEVRAAGVTATVATRNEALPDCVGRTVEVVTSAAIQAAFDAALPCDTIEIQPGTYVGPFTIRADGRADAYITITGADVVLSGNAGAVGTILTLDDADYVRIAGITIRDAGGNLVQFRNGSDHAIIDGNQLIEPGYRMVTKPSDTSAALHFRQDSNYAVIRNNTFHRETVMTTKLGFPGIFNWTAGKGQIISGNTFTGGFEDGMRWAPEDTASLNRAQDLDIYDNTIDGACFDDAIQPEGVGINVRIWGNEIRHCFIGIATAPLIEGPLYIFRNTITESQHPTRGGSAAYKLGDEDPGRRGRKYYYHNTVITGGEPGDVAGYKQTNSGLGGITSRNNIMVVGRYLYEGGCDEWCSLDYDALWTSDPSRFVEYRGPRSGSPAEWCAVAGQACHSIEVDAAANPDAGIDQGALILGFNDPHSAWPMVGTAPDIGARER